MKKTQIKYRGAPALIVCDGKCEKAWGVNGRKDDLIIAYDENEPDDIAYKADHEIGIAPKDTGTYEGGEGKPSVPGEHNKWCARECERSRLIRPGEEISCWDFSSRFHNQPAKHPETKNLVHSAGEIFRP